MLTHQSWLDAAACLFAILLFSQPTNWVPGIDILDSFICHAWNGQFVYWYAVHTSIWNLVLIALERYLAVCHPFKHANYTRRRIYASFVAIHILGIVCSIACAFQTYMEDGVCLSGNLLKGAIIERLFYAYAISAFLSYYAVPCAAFFFFYGSVALKMRRRQNNSKFESNKIIDTAARQLTKTAITVTVIFFVALGYDLWYYVLGNTGVTEYRFNTPLQKIGVWLSVFNFVANPFVYALLMPTYRKSVINTFCACVERRKENSTTPADSCATVCSEVA